MNKLLIKNGTCIINSLQVKKDVLTEDGKILLIKENIQDPEAKIIDANNQFVLPGIIDSQVHFREPGLTHKEDLETGSKAAALGGVTMFFEMPNTNPATTTKKAIQEKINLAKEKSITNFAFFVGATGENLQDLKEAIQLEHCCGIKIFLGSSTGSLLLYDQEKLLEIFSSIDAPIAVHSENEEMLKARTSIRDKATTAHAHPEWRNEETAFSSTKMIIEIAKKAQRKVHVLHITTQKEIEYLKENKDHCTIECTPQHLTLMAPRCYDELGSYAQMNPPIRTKEHQDALWLGIKNGAVDVLGSDHAPHTKEEKDQGYPRSPSGMPGVQTILPIMLNHVSNGKISLEKLVELLSSQPAKMYHYKTKGQLQQGFDADITIVDMNKEFIIKNEDQASRCAWTPYHGKKIKGCPTHTIVNGKLVMKDGEIL
jgi:dihydroorotase